MIKTVYRRIKASAPLNGFLSMPESAHFARVVQLLDTYGLKLVKIDGGNYAFSR